MKRSTKIETAGFVLFFVGSMFIQMYIDSVLYLGIGMLYIAFMLIDAKLNEIEHEKHMDELHELRNKIDLSLEGMRKFVESDEINDDSEYFDNKRSETDKEK